MVRVCDRCVCQVLGAVSGARTVRATASMRDAMGGTGYAGYVICYAWGNSQVPRAGTMFTICECAICALGCECVGYGITMVSVSCDDDMYAMCRSGSGGCDDSCLVWDCDDVDDDSTGCGAVGSVRMHQVSAYVRICV